MSRLLVVDDDDLITEFVTIALKSVGFSVHTANSGRKSLIALETEPFDAVITDLFMADGDGAELIMSMRARGHSIPVLGMSGGADKLFNPFAKVMVAVGANAVIRKPFTKPELLSAVNAVLDPHLEEVK